MNRVLVLRVAPVAGALTVGFGAFASPYASSWTSYTPGTGASGTYLNPQSAVGSPARFTGVAGGWPGVVSPFNSPWDSDQIVSIGRGGHLTLAFDHDVYNRATNAFGFDFIVFTNMFYVDSGGSASSKFATLGGTIEVSKDGIDWRLVNGADPNGGYASMGYVDSGPGDSTPGSVPSDFSKPVDPAFNPIGKTYAQIVAGYNGSGGGTGVDFASTGLDFIRFVRIANPEGNTGSIHIDGIAEVPTPVTASLFVIASIIAPRRRRA